MVILHSSDQYLLQVLDMRFTIGPHFFTSPAPTIWNRSSLLIRLCLSPIKFLFNVFSNSQVQ